jgi:TonB-linked SusC/RagA family outer membrane protein
MSIKTSGLVKLLLSAVLVLCGAEALAQTITGKVLDQDRNPLPGVSVYLKGTTNGVMTDSAGNYFINNRTGSKILVFSCVGLKEIEMTIANRSVINVFMEEDLNVLDETVVIGYQQVQRRDLMGAVSSADSKAVSAIPSPNFTSSLAGKLAGVDVKTTEGDPDADVQIRVRGTGSITQDASPLYIVDGFPVNSISDINPQDIKSVDVLKDAFSTAIYGSRGAYGVVLVTTKEGSRGRVSVSYDGYGGIKKMANIDNYELMTPYQFAQSVYESAMVFNTPTAYTTRFGDFQDMGLYKTIDGNDWRRRLFGRTGTTMNHFINVSGSSDKVRWSASYGRMDEDAIMIYSSFHRNNLSFRTNYTPVKKLAFNFSLRYSSTTIEGSGSNSVNDKGNNAGTGRMLQAMKYSPIPMNYLQDIEDYDIYSQEFGTNPIRDVVDNDNHRKRENWNFSGNVTWTIIPNLRLKVEGGVDNWEEIHERFYGLSAYFTRVKADVPNKPSTDNSTGYSRTYRNVNTLSYNFAEIFKKDKRHRLDLMLGQEFSFRKVRTETVVAQGFPVFYDADMARRYRSSASLISAAGNAYAENEVMLSFFGRANYVFDNRYSVSGALRADGSSKFAPGHQWGFFPSAAVSWTISNEPWFKKVKNIDQIKIRYSFGAAGNNRIPSGQVFRLFSSGQDTRIYNVTNRIVAKSVMPNENLEWEKTLSHNIGLDFAFFKQRLSGTFELYHNTSKDLLVNFPLSGVGYASQYRNIGSVLNRGIELSLRGVLLEKKNVGITISGNVAFNQNRVLSLGGLEEIQTESRIESSLGWDYVVKPGDPLGVIYGYESDGWYLVDDFDMTINSSSGLPSWKLKEGVADATDVIASLGMRPGSPKFKDQNGDGRINSDDKVRIGSALPFLTGGFNFSAVIYGIDLSAAFNFSMGNKIYNGDKLSITQRTRQGRYRRLSSICAPGSAWTNIDWSTGAVITDPDLLAEVNKDAKMFAPTMDNLFLSDYYIEDGSFLRFSTLTIGYTIPASITQWAHISKLRIYASASNLFCWTNYSGYDPEVDCRRSTPMTPGIDFSAYPKSISIIGGLNLSF